MKCTVEIEQEKKVEAIQNARLRIIPGAAKSVTVVPVPLLHRAILGSQVHPQSRAYTHLTASPIPRYFNLCVAGSVQLS